VVINTNNHFGFGSDVDDNNNLDDDDKWRTATL